MFVMTKVKCQICGKDLHPLPYICNYCGGSFCVNHRLPEKHDCPKIEMVREPVRAVQLKDLQNEILEYEEAQKETKKNILRRIKKKLGF